MNLRGQCQSFSVAVATQNFGNSYKDSVRDVRLTGASLIMFQRTAATDLQLSLVTDCVNSTEVHQGDSSRCTDVDAKDDALVRKRLYCFSADGCKRVHGLRGECMSMGNDPRQFLASRCLAGRNICVQ